MNLSKQEAIELEEKLIVKLIKSVKRIQFEVLNNDKCVIDKVDFLITDKERTLLQGKDDKEKVFNLSVTVKELDSYQDQDDYDDYQEYANMMNNRKERVDTFE